MPVAASMYWHLCHLSGSHAILQYLSLHVWCVRGAGAIPGRVARQDADFPSAGFERPIVEAVV